MKKMLLLCLCAIALVCATSCQKEEQLIENMDAFVSMILKSKPSVVKGTYVKNIAISSTMGPGIKIDANSFDK